MLVNVNILWWHVSAQLLCKDYHDRVTEEDRHLLPARHRSERGNYVRLQIPTWGKQNSLPLRCHWLSWLPEL